MSRGSAAVALHVLNLEPSQLADTRTRYGRKFDQ